MKKIPVAKPVLFHIEIDVSTYTQTTRHADPTDKWDRDSTAVETHINGIRIKTDKDYRDISLSFQPESGKTYYLLHATYSTGDSFGSDDGCKLYFELYRDEELAKRAHEQLEEHHRAYAALDKSKKTLKQFSPYSCEITVDGGSKQTVHIPYHGYFEGLDSIEITPVEVLEK